MRACWLSLFALTAVSPSLAAQALNPTPSERDLVAHHAIYRLSFAGSPNNAVSGATGTMDFDVLDSCDGWATQQRLVLDIVNQGGSAEHLVSDYATWEAKDGSRLRFRVRQASDGEVTSEIAGTADAVRGHRGKIVYTEPKRMTLTLPNGTLFPMAHTARIVALAAAGQKFMTLPLFDGSSDAGAEDTFVVVTGVHRPGQGLVPMLKSLPSDNVNIAFFDRGNLDQQPDYAVAMRYWSNGVADNLRMDFGDFIMNGTLVRFFPAPHAC